MAGQTIDLTAEDSNALGVRSTMTTETMTAQDTDLTTKHPTECPQRKHSFQHEWLNSPIIDIKIDCSAEPGRVQTQQSSVSVHQEVACACSKFFRNSYRNDTIERETMQVDFTYGDEFPINGANFLIIIAFMYSDQLEKSLALDDDRWTKIYRGAQYLGMDSLMNKLMDIMTDAMKCQRRQGTIKPHLAPVIATKLWCSPIFDFYVDCFCHDTDPNWKEIGAHYPSKLLLECLKRKHQGLRKSLPYKRRNCWWHVHSKHKITKLSSG